MEKWGKAIGAFMPNNFCAPKVPAELSAKLIEELLILPILTLFSCTVKTPPAGQRVALRSLSLVNDKVSVP